MKLFLLLLLGALISCERTDDRIHFELVMDAVMHKVSAAQNQDCSQQKAYNSEKMSVAHVVLLLLSLKLF